MGGERGSGGVRWAPPRGARHPDTGAWRWALLARPESDFATDMERQVVHAYRRLVAELVTARLAQELSVRDLSAASGVSLSRLTGLENGSSWPKLTTCNAVAAALAGRLTADGYPDIRGRLLRQVERHPQLTRVTVSRLAALRPNTVYDLADPNRSPSIATVLAVAEVVRARVTLVEGAEPRGAGPRRHPTSLPVR